MAQNEFDNALGTLLVGIFVNLFLCGLVTLQFADYRYKNYNDALWIKALVIALFCIDMFHTITTLYMAWAYFVVNYANPSILTSSALWPYIFTPIGTALVGILTHVFLGYQILSITGSHTLQTAVFALSGVTFGSGVTSGIKAYTMAIPFEFGALRTLVTWWLAVQVVLDIFSSGVLVYNSNLKREDFPSKKTRVNRILDGAISANIGGALFSLAAMIAFITSPRTNLFMAFSVPLGRVYSAAVMHTLIMRDTLPDTNTSPKVTSIVFRSRSSITRAALNSVELCKIPLDEYAQTDHEQNLHNAEPPTQPNDAKFNLADSSDEMFSVNHAV